MGIYPYDYVNAPSKLDETALPSKAAFYNSLTDEHINDEQYARAHEMWERLSMKTMRDYTRHYMVLDVLILADATPCTMLTGSSACTFRACRVSRCRWH